MPNSSCLTYSNTDSDLNAELFRSSGDCIKLFGLDGRLNILNPGGVLALELADADELVGELWWELWPSESRELVKSTFDTAKAGSVRSFHAFCPTAKGTPKWWDVVASPIFSSEGSVKGVMVVSRDVSELAFARLALQKANERKDDFLAIVAHELRNPISASLTATELMKMEQFDHRRTVDIVNLIQRQLGYMNRIAEDLLDASRIGRGDIHLRTEKVDVKRLVAEAVEQLEPAFTSKRLILTTSSCTDDCIVDGDHTRLLQILGNLLGNAARYTPTGGRIHLALNRTDQSISFSVKDSGIGIPLERLTSIFEIYSQVTKSSDRKSDGLGLGLSLVRALVNLHGGMVTAESGGVNAGSQFTVVLPATH